MTDKNQNPSLYDKCYFEIDAILNNDKLVNLLNSNEEFANLLNNQIKLLQQSKLDNNSFDHIHLKFLELYENKWLLKDIDIHLADENSLDNEIKCKQKRIRSLIYDKKMINVSDLVENAISPEELIQEDENDTNTNKEEEQIESKPIDDLTPEEKRLINLKKMSLTDKFKHARSEKWFKKIRLSHINLYIVIRKKEYVASREKVLFAEFIKFWNIEFDTNITPSSQTKEFDRLYTKYVKGFSYSWAIRIWLFIVGIPILITLLVFIIIVAVHDGQVSNENPSAPQLFEYLLQLFKF